MGNDTPWAIQAMAPEEEQAMRQMLREWHDENGYSYAEGYAFLLLQVWRHTRILMLMDQAGVDEHDGLARDDIECLITSASYVLGRRPGEDIAEFEQTMRDGIAWRMQQVVTMPYKDYLQTTEWQDVRYFALLRAGHRCQTCNSPRRLQVHHRTYAHRGVERLEDVTVLCGVCHEAFHATRKLAR